VLSGNTIVSSSASAGEGIVAYVAETYPAGTKVANAHLLVASPELLEACKDAKAKLQLLLPDSGVLSDRITDTVLKLTDAIAKAEGTQDAATDAAAMMEGRRKQR
jgi:hypothetical protein